MKKLVILYSAILLVLLPAILLIGCQRQPAPPTTETEIPADFTTYADKQGLFSISYPYDWEIVPLEEEIEYSVSKIITCIESDVPLDRTHVFFVAALPTTGNYPMVQIMFEPLPEGVRTHNEMIDAKIAEIKSFWQNYYEHSRVETNINGRESTIVDYEANFDDDRLRVLAMAGILMDRFSWGVSCASATKEFSKWEGDFHHIIRSFRILK